MGVTDALLNELPGSLTSLWVESSCTDFRGTFQRLPPSLTTLRLHLCHTLVIPRFDLLSPNLRTLGAQARHDTRTHTRIHTHTTRACVRAIAHMVPAAFQT